MSRLTTKTFAKYYQYIGKDDTAFEKCMGFLRDKEIHPRRDLIELLKEQKGFYEQYHDILTQLYYSNADFVENATFAEKREIRDLLTGGLHSQQQDYKAIKKYLDGQMTFSREDFRRMEDENGRYYLNTHDGTKKRYPSFSTVKEFIKPFDRTIWINSLKKKHPDWDMDQIVAFMDKESEWGRNRGSLMHEMIEDYLANRRTFELEHDFSETHPEVKLCFDKILPFLKYEVDTVLMIEPFVELDMEPSLKILGAGALGYIDLVGTHNDKVVVYDWKSAKKRKYADTIDGYRWQVALYCAMLKYTYGISADEARIVISPVSGGLQVVTMDRDEIKYNLITILKHFKSYFIHKQVFDAA